MTSKRPNIVIIMADELRDDIVRHGFTPAPALPNLDRLRTQGVTFTNSFCQTPTCCPSRGSFVTGKYPHQLGLWNHGDRLPPEERTRGHHFTAHGYDAVAIGKTPSMCPGFRLIPYDRNHAFVGNHGYTVTDDDCVGIFEGPRRSTAISSPAGSSTSAWRIATRTSRSSHTSASTPRIRRRACEPLDIPALLRELPLSRRVLERKFRRHIGRSPLQEIRRGRTERIQALLAGTDLPMSAIARETGFARPQRMAVLFRQETGLTPLEYRRQFQTRMPDGDPTAVRP